MQLNALMATQFVLPSIPKVVALLLSELERDEPDLKRICQLIGTDPSLTARLLQLSNSGFFKLSGRIHSVAESLALVGLKHVRTMAASAAAAASLKAVPGINLQQYWDFSLDVAKVSRSLAGVVRQNQQAAFTAGMIHCVGELAMRMAMPLTLGALDADAPRAGLPNAERVDAATVRADLVGPAHLRRATRRETASHQTGLARCTRRRGTAGRRDADLPLAADLVAGTVSRAVALDDLLSSTAVAAGEHEARKCERDHRGVPHGAELHQECRQGRARRLGCDGDFALPGCRSGRGEIGHENSCFGARGDDVDIRADARPAARAGHHQSTVHPLARGSVDPLRTAGPRDRCARG